ncbi:hypothetical protein EC968_003986 [Mortierella alpina]|nr:hypothetical protein EC968_003986 [Mortierella alpina]
MHTPIRPKKVVTLSEGPFLTAETSQRTLRGTFFDLNENIQYITITVPSEPSEEMEQLWTELVRKGEDEAAGARLRVSGALDISPCVKKGGQAGQNLKFQNTRMRAADDVKMKPVDRRLPRNAQFRRRLDDQEQPAQDSQLIPSQSDVLPVPEQGRQAPKNRR